MCGIVGFNSSDQKVCQNMLRLLDHRGPDQSGNFVDSGITLGHQRLSILDLSVKGKQPMTYKEFTISFNGEIYNFRDLKRELAGSYKSETDTEVILHAFARDGVKAIASLNGDFAFAVYDSKRRVVTLARDRIGIKPLYYYFDGETFAFASELKALIAHPKIKREINYQSLYRALTFRYVPGEDSIITGVKKVTPGTYITFDLKKKQLATYRYWDVPSVKKARSDREVSLQIQSLLLDSVRKRLISDVPLGAYLSGGIDSSAIIAAMSKVQEASVKTFSIGFGYGEYTDELTYAKSISELFGTDHHEYTIAADIIKEVPNIVWHSDEPISDTAHIPFYFLAKHAKKDVTVVLSGEGGDELFAGYEHYKFVPLIKRINRFGIAGSIAAKAGLQLTPSFMLNRIFKYSRALGAEGRKRAVNAIEKRGDADKYREIVSIFNAEEQSQLWKEPTDSLNAELSSFIASYFGGNVVDAMTRYELRTQLPESYLMKGDKMNMAHGVEARVPILDHRLVELAFSLPVEQKLRGRNEKYIFKKALQGLVPNEILKRKKQRFYVPIDLWVRDLMPVYQDRLSEKRISQLGFDYPAVQKIMSNFSKSPLFYSRQLWTLLTFDVWYELYIDNVPPDKVFT